METGCLLRWCLMKGSNMISVCFHSPSTASPGNGWCFNYIHLITISRYFVFSSLMCPSFKCLVPRIQHLPLVIYKIPGASPLFLEDFYPWHTAIFSNSMLGLILDFHMNAQFSLLKAGFSVHSLPLLQPQLQTSSLSQPCLSSFHHNTRWFSRAALEVSCDQNAIFNNSWLH